MPHGAIALATRRQAWRPLLLRSGTRTSVLASPRRPVTTPSAFGSKRFSVRSVLQAMSADEGAARVAVGHDFGRRPTAGESGRRATRSMSPPEARLVTSKRVCTRRVCSGTRFTSQSKSQFGSDGDRAWFKWNEPATSAQGARVILEIVIPTDDLTAPTVEPPPHEKAKIVLLDPAPAGEMTVISVVITSPGLEVHADPDHDQQSAGPQALPGPARGGTTGARHECSRDVAAMVPGWLTPMPATRASRLLSRESARAVDWTWALRLPMQTPASCWVRQAFRSVATQARLRCCRTRERSPCW